MPTKIAINGFGSTGHMFLRAVLHRAELELVAVNDLADAETLTHLLIHDSIHGTLKYEIKVEGDSIFDAGRSIQIFSEHNPAKLPWERLGVRIAIESSGKFRTREKAKLHLDAGASKILLSAQARTLT
jgi:glyceraldehyde 3-phosphate dehydrogenase (phosphorylating)